MKFRVVHVDGSKKGQTESFDVPSLTVGRDPSNVLAFDPHKDDRVSTRHAEIKEQGGTVMLTDLGSRNGTFVGGSKIQGSVAITSGSLIQFGEKGPMVTVHFEAAAPAPATAPMPVAAPPPQPKKGGCGGCVIAIVVIFVLLVLGGVIGAVVYFWGDISAKIKSPSSTSNDTGGSPDTKTGSSPDTKSGGDKTGPKETESPWKTAGIGSSYDFETKVHVEGQEKDLQSSQKWTLVGRTDTMAKIKLETFGPDGKPAGEPTEMQLPLKNPPAFKNPNQKIEEKDETIETPAGKFECHYTRIESKFGDQVSVVESWLPKDLPVPAKSITKSSASTVSMMLTKIDKK
ncbi:FHA domain-containing protein [bacterium]|nr:FHA domain-containing protein [bacterium]